MVYSLCSLTETDFCEQAVETAVLEVAMEPALADTAAAVMPVDMEAAMAVTEVETAVASEAAAVEAVSEVEMTVFIIYAPKIKFNISISGFCFSCFKISINELRQFCGSRTTQKAQLIHMVIN
jgi:hypothetical protein